MKIGNVSIIKIILKNAWLDGNRGVNLFAEPILNNTEILNPKTDKLIEDERILYLKVPIFNKSKVLKDELKE